MHYTRHYTPIMLSVFFCTPGMPVLCPDYATNTPFYAQCPQYALILHSTPIIGIMRA